ncbi:MAG: DNA polymerase I [Clostridia bacterium]|nr:DNA polymerase I [Clostridia bacterium]
MKTLLVADGNSLANRAFYGVRNLSTRMGFPTNAVFGFINIIGREIERTEPDFAVMAFDVHAPTFRHKMFDAYKGTRKPMPEDLCVQMPYIARAAAALGFTIVEKEGYEADDILGSYSKMADDEGGFRTYLLTGDKDSFQLISDSTSVLYASNGDRILYDRQFFCEKYGVDPSQFVDVKAIMGDSSDNIPGIAGIGEKGALALIQQFGSLDEIYRDGRYSDKNSGLKPGMIAKLEAGKGSAYMSRELAEIFREVPGIPSLGELKPVRLDRGAAKKLFLELEFSALIKKYRLTSSEPGESGDDEDENAAGDQKDKDLQGTDAEKNAEEFTPEAAVACGGAVSLSSDGSSVCFSDGSGVCSLPLNEGFRFVAANSSKLCFHDAKSFCRSAAEHGVRISGIGFDVMLAAYVLDPQTKFGLGDLVNYYLEDIVSEDNPDAVYIARLTPVLKEKLRSAKDAERLLSDVEIPLSDVLCEMETEGFRLDTAGLASYGSKLLEEAEDVKEAVYAAAGGEFNLNSPKQLGEVLFVRLGLPSGKKNSNGYSTNAEILEKLAPAYPVVSDILRYRKLTKLYGTYVAGLLKTADQNGFVHTLFRQTGTATGRLSSAEPNLQNIPIKTEEGRELRRFFLPKEGHILIDADYSQIELRILASISGDENMIAAFRSGADIHRSTAAAVFGVAPEDVTPIMRKRAKAVNFGIVYGIGEYSLSQDLGISVKQAGDYIRDYFKAYPGVEAYLSESVADAAKKGYTETLFGRRRYIPELSAKNGNLRKYGERVAMNSPIQGTAADIIKIAMIKTAKRLKDEGLDARLILQIHDELIVDSATDCAGRAAEILRESMESAADLPVKLTVDLETGDSLYI